MVETSEVGPTAHAKPERPSLRGAWLALALTTYCQTAVATVSQSTGTLAPFFQSEFGISRAEIGIGIALLYVGNMLATIPAGRACDVWGERPILIISGIVCGLAAILGAQSPTFLMVLAFLFVIGLGNGLQAPGGSAAIIRWFPQPRRGLAFGIRQTGLPAGTAIAAIVIPWIAVQSNWRVAWIVLAAVSISGAAMIFLAYRSRHDRSTGVGAAAPRRSMRDVLADRNLRLLILYTTSHLVIQFSVTSFFVVFVHEVLGYSVVAAGALFGVVNVIALVGRIGWGAISDLFLGGDRRTGLLIISGLSLAACLIGAGLSAGLPSWLVAILVVLLGSSTMAWTGLQIALASEMAGSATAGTAVGLVVGISTVGILVGPPLFGLVVDATHSYTVAWLSGALILALGTIALRYIRPSAG